MGPRNGVPRGAPRGDDKPLSRSSRQKRADARGRVGELLHWRAIEILEPFAGENGADRAFRDALAFAQEVGPVGRAQRVVGIMGGEEDAMASPGERADLAHDLALVAEI